MNKEKQRIAIAEACGYEKRYSSYWECDCWFDPEDTPLDGSSDVVLPDYLNDLNAMHEAELLFSRADQPVDRWLDYVHQLCLRLGESEWGFANASQRAEAFLRTIGKWEEEE